MGMEIERKFLVKNDSWRPGAVGETFCQGYCRGETGTVRIRITGEKAFLTIKSRTEGISRREFEYPIPVADAKELLEIICAKPYIRKTRYLVEFAGKRWEVDVFEGDNFGLVMAEIELEHEDERFELPPWVGQEVSADPRYANSNLAVNPFSRWTTT